MNNEWAIASSEVHAALLGNQGLVFLESSVIAQGLPWPENLQTVEAVEAAIRSLGAIPATLAVLGRKLRVGLNHAELESLAGTVRSPCKVGRDEGGRLVETSPRPLLKASRRDLARALQKGIDAATTVSATLFVVRHITRGAVGVMATGGLGGVHHGAVDTWDISMDLDELSRADGCMVVCSGFKSILDLPASLEVLETRGVTIVGYRTRELPAFTVASSGLELDHSVESPEEAASLLSIHRKLGIPGAIVLVNPVPLADALDREAAETALEAALGAAEQQRVRGKALTPFLLESVRHATGGASLRANQALLVSNAMLAAEVAVAVQGSVGL